MAAQNSPNADLEQSLFKANLKELKLRQRVVLIALVPTAIGALWLIFSLYQVTTLQHQAHAVAEREAQTESREKAALQQVAEANTKRDASEKRAETSLALEKAAKESAADAQRRLIKARAEVGSIATILSDISSIKIKAAKLNNSEGVETELSDMRTTLGRTIGRIEQEIDKGLPETERKPRVYLFFADDAQRETAKTLIPVLAGAGFDATLARSPGRRTEATEIRYFHDSRDKAEASKLLGLIITQPGLADCRLNSTTDPDHATGTRKFQIWFGKPAAATPR